MTSPETCTHEEVKVKSCENDSHSSLGDGIGCLEHYCTNCKASVHDLCDHQGGSRTWQDCDTPEHPEDCVVGCCDICGADVSHDYGVPQLEDTTNIDYFKKSLSEDNDLAEELPKSTEALGWKDSQQFRDIMYNEFYKKKPRGENE